jgi:hypothetical protein
MSDVTSEPVMEPSEPASEAFPLPVTETVAEQSPPHSNPVPVAPDTLVPHEGALQKLENYIAGWPRTFFHPVHGSKEFKDPNEHAQAGSDWRFPSAGEADSARTQTEAELVNLKRQMSALASYEANAPVARSSAQAEESMASGYPEPGLG